MPSIPWRSGALAGIAAGVVATLVQIALWWASSHPLPEILFRDARLTAAIVMGREALPPPATFAWSI
ncbi:MAG: sodium:proline symporter, partial [Betaproteobacteria bacterium]